MNLPFLSAMSGSDSFCEVFGKTASFYFEPESDLALLQDQANGAFSARHVVYQQPQQVVMAGQQPQQIVSNGAVYQAQPQQVQAPQ